MQLQHSALFRLNVGVQDYSSPLTAEASSYVCILKSVSLSILQSI